MRDPYGFGVLLASLREPIPADPELDALLDTLDGVAVNDNAAPAEEPAPVPGLVTTASSRPRPLRRRSGLRQKEDARRIRAHGRVAAEEVVEHLPPSTPTTTPSHTPTTRATTTIITGPTYRRGIASWEEAGELPRVIACNRGLPELGQPFAFSLNVDPKHLAAGHAHARGLLDYLRRRVALELKRALGRTPPMWLVVETDDDGRPHLHGGIALNDNDTPARVETALAKAGGGWTRRGSAPADVRVQWDADGWAAYPLKRMERTRRHLREAAGLAPGARVALYSVSDDLRAIGQRIHADTRKAIGRK